MAFRYVSPHRSIIGSAVAGTVDADFTNDWLTDGRPGFPVKTTGDLSLTVTPTASLSVDVIAVCRHTINQAATIALGGDLSSSIVTAAATPDRIPLNWYRLLGAPVTVSSIVLGITGNTDPIVVGELYAGLSKTFRCANFAQGRQFDPGQPFAWESEVAPYPSGLSKPRRLSGLVLLDDDEYADLLAWDQATDSGTIPSLIIPDDTVNDAWLAQFQFTETTNAGEHQVQLQVVEIPRTRW